MWLLFFSIILGHLLGLSLLRTKENSLWGSTDCTSLLCFSFWALQMETQDQPHHVFRWISKMEACWAAQRTLAQHSERFYFYCGLRGNKGYRVFPNCPQVSYSWVASPPFNPTFPPHLGCTSSHLSPMRPQRIHLEKSTPLFHLLQLYAATSLECSE